MAKVKKKGGIARSIVALALGTMAAKLAMKGAEKIWTAGFRQDVPRMVEEESIVRKAAWVALSAALVGMAREIAKDLAAPKARAA
jgi:hypothetical protein